MPARKFLTDNSAKKQKPDSSPVDTIKTAGSDEGLFLFSSSERPVNRACRGSIRDTFDLSSPGVGALMLHF
jgi:hypothetical protein